MRSSVVSGWPELQVNGYDTQVNEEAFIPTANELQLVRMERLSNNVLLCLFAGEVKTVDVHQKPEALHFGLDQADTSYNKELRNSQGVESSDDITVDIVWRGSGAERVIDVAAFATTMQDTLKEKLNNVNNWSPFTSAQFALQMIEGVEKVRFTIDEN